MPVQAFGIPSKQEPRGFQAVEALWHLDSLLALLVLWRAVGFTVHLPGAESRRELQLAEEFVFGHPC